jgi:hypothetical protein
VPREAIARGGKLVRGDGQRGACGIGPHEHDGMGPVAVGDARFDPVGQDDAVGLLAGVEQAQVDDDAVAPGFAAGGAIVFRLPQGPSDEHFDMRGGHRGAGHGRQGERNEPGGTGLEGKEYHGGILCCPARGSTIWMGKSVERRVSAGPCLHLRVHNWRADGYRAGMTMPAHALPDPSTVAALFDVDLVGWLTSFICLATAFVLGMLIGLERQWRQRTAGLRTNVLVAVGAAAFADLGLRMAGADGGSGSFPRWFRASAFWGPGSS